MEPKQLIPLGRIAEFVNEPPHRIIHLCERDLVRPAVPAEGRGTVRRFDRDNTFRIILALYLEDLGLQHDVIRLLMDGIDELLRNEEVKENIDANIVIDAPMVFNQLGDNENPAMGLVVLTNGRERQAQFSLPKCRFMHRQTGSIFLTSLSMDQFTGGTVLCVAVNLTHIAQLLI